MPYKLCYTPLSWKIAILLVPFNIVKKLNNSKDGSNKKMYFWYIFKEFELRNELRESKILVTVEPGHIYCRKWNFKFFLFHRSNNIMHWSTCPYTHYKVLTAITFCNIQLVYKVLIARTLCNIQQVSIPSIQSLSITFYMLILSLYSIWSHQSNNIIALLHLSVYPA